MQRNSGKQILRKQHFVRARRDKSDGNFIVYKKKNYPAPYLILSQIIIKNEQENTSEKMMTFNKILVHKFILKIAMRKDRCLT